MFFRCRIVISAVIIVLLLTGVVYAGDRTENEGKPSQGQGETFLGKWYSGKGTAEFKPYGTMVYNGQGYYYTAQNGVLTLLGTEGISALPYSFTRGFLVVTIDGVGTTFTRNQTARKEIRQQGTVSSDLSGKWCYMSNVSATGGGRMSNRCFTLYEKGTYEYYSETSSSGAYGSAASQDSDRGTWTATATSITANSSRNGVRIYRLQKRNHPKTGDPMLVLDGDAYVTYYNKRPW